MTKIGHTGTFSKINLFLANQMDRPTKVKFERCIRFLLESSFESRDDKYCNTVYVKVEGGLSAKGQEN